MPRGVRTKGRRPTANDLNEVQLRIYGALPGVELRDLYLSSLPDITEAPVSAKKKIQAIQDRVTLLEHVLGQLKEHRGHLSGLAHDLENGRGDAERIDLRKELAPPEIRGVSLRYVRGPRGGGDGE